MDVQEPVVIGTDFLGYRIEELIGRGGMGVVYRAYDLRLKRPVALKLVAPALARDERFRERFARESELVMSLEHPNVVPIYDAGEVDSHVYLAMRLVDGIDLGSLLKSEGALESARSAAICAQIAAALDAAHARGLVHRDVKPSNVLLDASEHVYLADFGLTRSLDDEGGAAGEDRSIGTPAYLAPEQLEGRPAAGRADVYSLGCLLYECLTGEPVFPRASRLAVAWAHLEDEPPRPSERRPGLPEAIDAVVERALAKDPEDRFATCGDLVAAAREALGLGKVAASHRRRSLLLAGAIGLAIAVAGVVLATTLDRGARNSAAPPLFARPNSLARIDPATNEVSAVIDVGAHPVVVAAAAQSVWVYNKGDMSISEVDARTNRVLRTTPVSGTTPAECCSLFAGPVLAADASGAWFVNGRADNKARLTHVLTDGGGKREYSLDLTPTGVAVGHRAVWVVGHRGRDSRLLRIDPATGRVTHKTRFPSNSRVDSIAYGFHAVWVMSSSTATLYRIDPGSARHAGSVVVVANSHATRPEITRYLHVISVRTTKDGGTDFDVDPFSVDTSKLTVSVNGEYEPPSSGEYNGDLGALWWYDWSSGNVSRQQAENVLPRDIHVTDDRTDGPCLTSITAGSGSLWVAAAAGPSPNGGPCVR
jgi:DNA-binding beta-propeller fold protein YncE